jgi:hypothetical protein
LQMGKQVISISITLAFAVRFFPIEKASQFAIDAARIDTVFAFLCRVDEQRLEQKGEQQIIHNEQMIRKVKAFSGL